MYFWDLGVKWFKYWNIHLYLNGKGSLVPSVLIYQMLSVFFHPPVSEWKGLTGSLGVDLSNAFCFLSPVAAPVSREWRGVPSCPAVPHPASLASRKHFSWWEVTDGLPGPFHSWIPRACQEVQLFTAKHTVDGVIIDCWSIYTHNLQAGQPFIDTSAFPHLFINTLTFINPFISICISMPLIYIQ